MVQIKTNQGEIKGAEIWLPKEVTGADSIFKFTNIPFALTKRFQKPVPYGYAMLWNILILKIIF